MLVSNKTLIKKLSWATSRPSAQASHKSHTQQVSEQPVNSILEKFQITQSPAGSVPATVSMSTAHYNNSFSVRANNLQQYDLLAVFLLRR